MQSRSHNELVVDKLQFYIDYLEQGKYNYVDSYGAVPFYVEIDKTRGQLVNKLISITFLSENEYQIQIPFENSSVSLLNYSTNTYSKTSVQPVSFVKKYKVGERVELPFLNWKLQIKDNLGFIRGKNILLNLMILMELYLVTKG